MKKFLSRYWFLFIFPLGFWPAIHFCIQEEKLKTFIYSEAINGNKKAIHLLKICSNPWKLDDRIVREALTGNPFAQEVLNIEEMK
jgi:hypothetical protein